MSPWWNLLFAVLLASGFWCRLGAPEFLIDRLRVALGYFGVRGGPTEDPSELSDPAVARQASADFFGISGVTGLVFTGWAERLSTAAPAWLAIDAVATSLGVGLLGAWILSRLAARGSERARTTRMSREITMIDVDGLSRQSTVPAGEPVRRANTESGS